MNDNYQKIKSENLDHLGIIAGIIDDLGIVVIVGWVEP